MWSRASSATLSALALSLPPDEARDAAPGTLYCDFQRHAFLLKINQCLMPSQTDLLGTYHLSGDLVSRSESAFSYGLQAEKQGRVQIQGSFLFAAVDYDSHFRQEILQQHYQDVFSCLLNVTKKD